MPLSKIHVVWRFAVSPVLLTAVPAASQDRTVLPLTVTNDMYPHASPDGRRGVFQSDVR